MVRALPVLLRSALVGALVVAGVGVAAPPPARADSAPPPPDPATVTADALPTVQVDGVIWTQVVVGRTVYAAGRFTTARPAGAAPGTSTVPRANILAFDIVTGALDSSFDPVLDGQVKSITASPDGSRVYVTGDFTRVDGVYRVRVAAFDTATGALVGSFRPTLASSGLAITATATRVYVGGEFTSVASTTGGTLVPRGYLAAFDATTGAVQPFRADANAPVTALTDTVDGQRVVVAGRFTTLAGTAAYGLASVHPTTAALQPFPVASAIRNAGTKSALTSLSADSTGIYGSGYHFGSGGNLEGAFRADPVTGALVWAADCHGDTYSTFRQRDVLYTVGHSHYCGNLPGGYPQTNPWTYDHLSTYTVEPRGSSTPDIYGYAAPPVGSPSPGWLHIRPTFTTGTFTGQGQAGWSVTGNDTYVVVGGEFPAVNGVAQQGLVRFATSDVAPDTQGPRIAGAAFNPSVVSDAAGQVRVQWSANWDRDNERLTYRLYRGSQAVPAVHERTVTKRWWVRDSMGFTDTGRTPGSTQQYRVTASDPHGNTVQSGWVSVVVAGAGTPSGYLAAVRADDPEQLWRLDEPSGTTARDSAGTDPLALGSGVARGTPGAVGDGTTASTFNGTSSGTAASTVPANAPDAFTVEAWVRTTSTSGGKVVGYGTSITGTSGTADRHLYLDDAGRVFFGMHSNALRTVNSTASVRDGAWHHLVGTYGAGVMTLYVDGTQVGQRSDVGWERSYWGQWRLGGDRLAGWPSRPTSDWLNGSIDDVAVYWSVLPAARVAAHWAARTGTPANQPPTAQLTAATAGLRVDVDGRTSSDVDGTVASWSWAFGDGATATGSTASHTYATAGTYRVVLTVRDDDGATATAEQDVTVTAPPTDGTLARDAFARETAGGWGSAEVGGAWSLLGAATSYAVTGGAGRQTVTAAGSTRTSSLAGVSSTSTSVRVGVSVDKAPTGGGTYVTVAARRVGTTDVGVRMKLLATGAVTVQAMAGGTQLASATLPGTHAAGTRFETRVEVVGTSPTTVRGKVWPAGSAEPAGWLVTGTDTTPALQTAGGVALTTYLSGSTTNAPVTATWDDLVAATVPAG